jgi:hypothetical protein
MKQFFFSFILSFCFFLTHVEAVEVSDLYQAKVEVNSQQVTERNRALKKALSAVLIKVSGNEQLLEQPEFKTAVQQYQQFVEKYHYQTRHDVTYLVAEFNEKKVNAVFQQADVPIWGNLRPQILVWIIDEQGLERQFVSESSETAIPELIADISLDKGLPIRLPLLDLTDRENIQLSDFWGRFAEPIRDASARYEAEAIIVIRLSDNTLVSVSTQDNNTEISDDSSILSGNQSCGSLCQENALAMDWTLITDTVEFSSKYDGSDKITLISTALNEATRRIYKKYVISNDNQQQVVLDIVNIDNLSTYHAVTEFLTTLSSVRSVKLVWVKGKVMRFELDLLGSPISFLSSLKLSQQLQPVFDPLADSNEQNLSQFYWQGER